MFLRHGAPECIRSDNGPEFVAKSVQEWLRLKGVALLYIMPGCPWQNAYAELPQPLSSRVFGPAVVPTVREAAVVVEAWRRYYNQERLHSSLNYVPPNEFEQKWHLAKRHQSNHNAAILPT